MPRKTLLILIIAGMLIVTGGMYWYFFGRGGNTSSGGQTPTSVFKNFLPFGGTSAPADIANTTGAGSTNTNQGGGISAIIQTNSKFHQITNYAVVGASFLEDTRPIQKLTQITNAPQANIAPTQPAVVTPAPATNNIPAIKNGKTSSKTKTSTPVVVAPPAPTSEIVPAIRYVKSLDGHVFEMFLDTKITGEVSNSTIPTTHEALFGNGANSLIYRYASDDGKTIESFIGSLGATKGEFMPENISDVSISPDGNKYFYLAPFSNGVAGVIQSFNDTKRNQIFSSPFTEWLTDWPSSQMIIVTTKASGSVPGYAYSINSSSGVLTKILGGIMGLTTKGNPGGTGIIYSSSTNGGPRLNIYTFSNHSSKDLNQYGLPEKCVWLNDSINIYCAIPNTINGTTLPDDWYQGLVSFTDSFIKINTQTGSASFVADSSNETPIDGTHLFLDDKEQALFFINKKDSTLWSLDLK